VYELAPTVAPTAYGPGGDGEEEDGFLPFGRVVDTVRLLVRDAVDRDGVGSTAEETDREDLEADEASEPRTRG
jgi:hypothetical protein